MSALHRNIIGPQGRRLRESAGLTREQLAGRIARQGGALTAQEIARIERRERRVKDHEVLMLAVALGVTVDALFPGNR